MKVLVVSGFLGAGKTTLIRTLLKRTGIRAAVLENEYGETDLDGRTIAKENPLQVLEFAEGCVCCTKKDSFANTIVAISAGLDPDYLIVEPSGVGKLSAILQNIRRVSYENIRLAGSILVVAPRSFHAVLHDYPEIFTDQMANADLIVLSKTESEDEGVIEDTVNNIRRYNPSAPILKTPYAGQDDAWWQNALFPAGKTPADHPKVPVKESTGPDPEQITLRDPSVPGYGALLVFLEDVLHGSFGQIVRAKGVLKVASSFVRFDVADGAYAVTGEEGEDIRAHAVFIGADLSEAPLRRRLSLRETPEGIKIRKKPCDHHRAVVPVHGTAV